MASRTEVIPVELPNGKIVQIQATMLGGEEDIAALGSMSFEGVTDALEGIAQAITATLQKVKPRKASVEFGLEVATEAGQLTALLVKGHGSASLTITLEWGE